MAVMAADSNAAQISVRTQPMKICSMYGITKGSKRA